ncbi:MAG: LPS export ABC transporter permease LptF [Sneathiellaceae bacterium]
MRSLQSYILRLLLGPFVFVVLALTGVVWLSQSLRFLDRIVNQGLDFGSFLYLTSLVLPGVLAVLIPVGLFCATLYTFNRLASDSELVVMWATGFSRWALAWPALLLAACCTVLVLFMNLYLTPLGARTLRTTQYELRTNLASVLLQEGVFNNPAQGLTVYVRERLPSGEMLGILIHDNRDKAKPITMMAERGALIRTPEGPRFMMINGNRQQVGGEGKALSLLYFDRYALDLDAYTERSGEGWREPHERYMNELLWPDMENADDRNNYWRFQVEAHSRMAGPLGTITLALIALAATLGGEYNRRGRYRRLVAAAFGAIGFLVLSIGLPYLANILPSTLVLLYLSPLIVSGAAIWLMLRDRPLGLGRLGRWIDRAGAVLAPRRAKA